DGGGIIAAEIHLTKRPKLFRQTEPPLNTVPAGHLYASSAPLFDPIVPVYVPSSVKPMPTCALELLEKTIVSNKRRKKLNLTHTELRYFGEHWYMPSNLI
ncbi:hypothetical protein, partial [Brucella gallinifaecis]|uniref:hypothetical protein n=1 Tax=Brucella gallinifaecis TaxID=215590 RepID=UPI001AEF15A4